MKSLVTSILVLSTFLVQADISRWQLFRLAPMPEPITNNAVTGNNIAGTPHMYTFGGLDSTLLFSGIHQRAYKFDFADQRWTALPDLPDTLGKIASAASTVKDKVYIIGGYHVFANGSERSSNRVHIFDPLTDQYLPDGAPVPVPIDDHVQDVWRDSLIYVVTGWHDDQNVNNVQIYNPTTDEWMAGTPVPDNDTFEAFGASGAILGDRIVYIGGARDSFNFPISSFIRVGIINPDNPAELIWNSIKSNNAAIYRAAAFTYLNSDFAWFGGSSETYNFDARAYTDGSLVQPGGSLIQFEDQLTTEGYINKTGEPFPRTMDYRGVAPLDEKNWMVCGGINDSGQVIRSAYRIHYNEPPSSVQEAKASGVFVYPNPVTDILQISTTNVANYAVYNILGERVLEGDINATKAQLDVSVLQNGQYLLQFNGLTFKFIKK